MLHRKRNLKGDLSNKFNKTIVERSSYDDLIKNVLIGDKKKHLKKFK